MKTFPAGFRHAGNYLSSSLILSILLILSTKLFGAFSLGKGYSIFEEGFRQVVQDDQDFAPGRRPGAKGSMTAAYAFSFRVTSWPFAGNVLFLMEGFKLARMVHVLALDHEGTVPEQQRNIEIRSI